ncbi:integrin alpha pat-2-like [Amphibalanus amphitrite]|uniref:integrin alpha pat-2-like n=1 Tax=Amphibalanus amphitrite TaxID=1232801 RepID=UPI001C914439|nr:integrin alpha pat-2-like [Amphibalanus amphitrite]
MASAECGCRAGVTFQACFKMESLEQLKTTVNLEYRLEAETFQPDRRFSRVRFLEGLPERRHVVERTLPLSADNTREYFCQEETMFIKVRNSRPGDAYEDGSEYESEYDGSTYQGATGGRARRPGGRRRGYYRRRRPIGGATGGNQSYTYRRQYESRRPLPADGLGPVDLATRRDELSSRRVQGGVERVEDLGDGTRRTYQAHRDLDGGDGFERELTTEEDRRTRRDVGVRRRREREMVVMPEAVTSPSGEVQQVVFFDCARNTAKCVQFRCRINSLKPNQYALVHIQGRIWNHTLVEDYDRVSYVSIKSRATLQMDPTLEQLQDVSDDVSMAETIAYPAVPAKAEDGGVPIWVIVVSVLAGLLLLAIICLILWKLGFFKRRRPDPTLKSNISR